MNNRLPIYQHQKRNVTKMFLWNLFPCRIILHNLAVDKVVFSGNPFNEIQAPTSQRFLYKCFKKL